MSEIFIDSYGKIWGGFVKSKSAAFKLAWRQAKHNLKTDESKTLKQLFKGLLSIAMKGFYKFKNGLAQIEKAEEEYAYYNKLSNYTMD